MTFHTASCCVSTVVLLALLAGCAAVPPATLVAGAAPAAASVAAPAPGAAVPASAAAAASAVSAAAAASAPAGAPRPDPAAPKPFDEVIKGATQQAGFVPLWRKDEKVWLEIAPERLDQPFLLSVNISHSIGERRLHGSQMGPSWLASFRKIGSNQIQLIALNTDYTAAGTAMKAAVEQGFSHSLIGSAAIASAPHPQRKSVLIDAAFLIADVPGYATVLEQAFRIPYGLDRGNSFFEAVRATDELTTLNARIHFATPRMPAPPLMPSPVPLPPPPRTTPDPRSFFVGYVYNFTRLPDKAMAPRRTDPRLGHFFEEVTDLSTDLDPSPKRFFIKRWRLEKADPAAALSEPRQPIVFWLDKNIPPPYRKSVEAGVLEWNKAFERIGFKNAIVTKQQPDDADWDTLDARHASIRWFVGVSTGLASGPSQADPRTGEIIDADIAMGDGFATGSRRFVVEDVGRSADSSVAASFAPLATAWRNRAHDAFCDYARESAAEMDFALDLMEARGDIAPDSPEADAFVQSVIKDTITHEIGHTLGLKHNFKASTAVTRAQLQDKDYTEKNGISGSVMDYVGYNLPVRGEKAGALNNTTLGPYDYWAIEYAYRPLDAATEKAELEKIAARSTEPQLAYADDADADGNAGIDPLVNRFDLGDDPLAYYRKRLQLSRELWDRVQERAPRAGDLPTRQRRQLMSGFARLNDAAVLAGKYVGGFYTVRDLPGTTGRPTYTPVEPARQREALQFLAQGLFSVESFRFKPQFLAGLSPDYNEWERAGPPNVPAAVLTLQTGAMDKLLSPGTASRLLDLPLYVGAAAGGAPAAAGGRDLISLAEVYSTLQDTIWSELKTGADIDRLRRNLQREHLKRVTALLTRGSAALPADALSLARLNATMLQAQLRRAGANTRLSIESRAHLQDSLVLLTEALRASMTRG